MQERQHAGGAAGMCDDGIAGNGSGRGSVYDWAHLLDNTQVHNG